ncbi:MAG TPA: hypothetical protein VIL32_00215, partial [Steroidobacteraceae bacterium]
MSRVPGPWWAARPAERNPFGFQEETTMSLVRYEPWNVLAQLQDEINRIFSNAFSSDSSGATAAWVPPVDITEYPNRFDLTVDLP